MTKNMPKQWMGLAGLLICALLASVPAAGSDTGDTGGHSGAVAASLDGSAGQADSGATAGESTGDAQVGGGSEDNAAAPEKSNTCFRERSCLTFGNCYPIPISFRTVGLPDHNGPWTFTSDASKCGLQVCPFPDLICQCGSKLLNTTCGV